MQIRIGGKGHLMPIRVDDFIPFLKDSNFTCYIGKGLGDYSVLRKKEGLGRGYIEIKYANQKECRSVEEQMKPLMAYFTPKKYPQRTPRSTTSIRIDKTLKENLEKLKDPNEKISDVVQGIYDYYIEHHG